MEFGVFHLRNRLAQAITEIGAMLLGLVLGSVTTLFHHRNHTFERLQGANVFCNAFSDIYMLYAGPCRPISGLIRVLNREPQAAEYNSPWRVGSE